MMTTLVLSVADIRQIVQKIGLHVLMDEMIARLTVALRNYEPDSTSIPARSGFHYHVPETGLLEWMPCLKVGGHATIKVVGYHPANPRLHNLPTILSTVSSYDSATGHLVGIADATFLTALRTGAASAIASGILAIPDARTVGLVGAGAQALTQLHALSRLFEIEQVFVYDSDPDVSRSFLSRSAFLGLEIIPIGQEALTSYLAAADVLCTATSVEIGCGPVIPNVDVKPWLHINAVGSDFPGKVELSQALLRRSIVCPDFREQALKEGECQQLAPDEIGPDLVKLLQHKQHYRHLGQTLTVFDSTGWALEDWVALEMMMDYAHDLHLGTHIQLESASFDPRDPYYFVQDSQQVEVHPQIFSQNGSIPVTTKPGET